MGTYVHFKHRLTQKLPGDPSVISLIIRIIFNKKNHLLKIVHTYLLHNIHSIDQSFKRQTAVPYLPLAILRSCRPKGSCAYIGPRLWLDLSSSFKVSEKTSPRCDIRGTITFEADEKFIGAGHLFLPRT